MATSAVKVPRVLPGQREQHEGLVSDIDCPPASDIQLSIAVEQHRLLRTTVTPAAASPGRTRWLEPSEEQQTGDDQADLDEDDEQVLADAPDDLSAGPGAGEGGGGERGAVEGNPGGKQVTGAVRGDLGEVRGESTGGLGADVGGAGQPVGEEERGGQRADGAEQGGGAGSERSSARRA
jgi:hypothetical protein